MDPNVKRWFEGHRKWMRPGAHLRVRPDAQKWLPAGIAHPTLPLPEERKYTSDQPADDAELRAFEMGLLEVKALFSELKLDLELQRLRRKYSPDQPRVPAGNSDGGQWTREGGGTPTIARPVMPAPGSPLRSPAVDLQQSFRTASDQWPREDLPRLRDVANDAWIAAEIRTAWAASNPYSENPRENGFWICRNETTGDLFARPFANRGFADMIVPGATPDDAVAFFHTHPSSPETGAHQGPSPQDEAFATSRGLPGLILSHNGMYYFGPDFRPWNPPSRP